MCVVAFGWKAHPRWRLILAGNRDEFHERPSAALARVDGRIGGRDLRSGGMWLGVSEAGRCAVVTNVAGQGNADPAAISRGRLVADALDGRPDPERLDGFNAFNLAVIDGETARLLTNRPVPTVRPLARGVHALSNGIAGEHWPRSDALEAALAHWLSGAADDLSLLFATMADEGGSPPLFIRDAVYGTRCSTIIAVAADGAGTIMERRFAASGNEAGETAISFQWGC